MRVYPGRRHITEARDLLWSFLHRRRVVLTGLPGGGKSTAARHLAAQLVDDQSLPFPVFVSLRHIDLPSAHQGIREQMIAFAIRDASDADREELREEINRRLDGDGPIALILDALDEAYDRRSALTSAIDTFAKSASENVFFLLTTRTVGFSDAKTLKWHALELGPPEHARSTARAILEATASHDGIAATEQDHWISVRAEWVSAHLEHDEILAETPLMVALLTVLASKRSGQQLPRTRGAVLQAVINDFVGRQEVAVRTSPQLARLAEGEQHLAGITAFAREASHLIAHPMGSSLAAVVDAVTDALHPDWITARGQAKGTATTLVRSFDEAGVFVINDQSEVTPRIQLLAEVGDAIQAINAPASLSSWIVARVEGRKYESVTLACLLSPEAVRMCVALLDDEVVGEAVAGILAAAEREGAEASANQAVALAGRLIAVVARPTHDGWRAARALMNLRHLPEECATPFLVAAATHDQARQSIVETHLLTRFPSRLQRDEGFAVLKDGFAVTRLPELENEHATSEDSFLFGLLDDGGVRDAQIQAARALLPGWPEFAEVVAARVNSNTPMGVTNDLIDALRTNEFGGIADRVATLYGPGGWNDFGGLEEPDLNDHYPRVLRDLSTLPAAEINAHQQISMVELGALLNDLGILSWGEPPIYKSEEFAHAYLDTAMSLLGFDPGAVSTQAREALRRMDRYDSVEPLFALRSDSHHDISWDGVTDPAAATSVLTAALRLHLHYTSFPVRALAHGPRDIVEPVLSKAVPLLERSPRHQMGAATSLVLATGGEAGRSWIASDNPFLRNIAAWSCTLDEQIGMLEDTDRGVRLSALDLIIKRDPPNLEAVLRNYLEIPECGWTCEDCRKRNDSWDDRDACPGCLHSAPDPRRRAETALHEL